MQGLFITVEGPDGSGKTTLVSELSKCLSEKIKIPLVTTREPGGSDVAEKIRELVLDAEYVEMDNRTEALLYAASRRQHIVEKIKPALERGEVVLCDRFVDSSIAYQGAGREIGVEEVATLNQFATENLTPDLTLYLDVDAQTGLNRIAHKDSNRLKDRLELEEITFHNRVQAAYQTLLKDNPDRMHRIDAAQTPEKVFMDSWKVIQDTLQTFDLLK